MRITWIRRVLLAGAALMFFGGRAVHALDPTTPLTDYRYRNWTTADGLPAGAIKALAQTPDGYLWIGTDAGLARFDGFQFYVHDRRSTPAFHASEVRALCTDGEGTLWIATQDGLIRMHRGEFSRIELSSEGDRHRSVYSLACRDRRGVFAGTRDGGVFSIETSVPVALTIWSPPSTRNTIMALAIDNDGSLLLAALRDGLHRCTRSKCTRIAIAEDEGFVSALQKSSTGSIWITKFTGGVLKLDAGASAAETPEFATQVQGPEFLPILEDRNHTLWFTVEDQLVRFSNNQITRAHSFVPETTVTPSALFEDADGNLWIGSADYGLHQLLDRRIENFGHSQDSITQNPIAIMTDSSGSLWVASRHDGVHKFTNGAGTRFYPELPELTSVSTIAQTRDKSMWFATNAGVFHSKNEGAPVLVNRSGAPRGPVGAFFLDSRGRFWAGSIDPGLTYLEGKDWHPITATDGFTANLAWSFAEGPDGTLWIGTLTSGLYRYSEGTFKNFGKENGLTGMIIAAVLVDSSGNLWFSVHDHGLHTIRKGRVIPLGERAGLSTDSLFSLIEDDHGSLWIGSNIGVFQLSIAQLEAVVRGELARATPRLYDTDDGMRRAECIRESQPAAWKGADGGLWFATKGGIIKIDPTQVARPETPPPTLIESVNVDGKRVEWDRVVALDSSAKRIEVAFTAVNLSAPTRIRFRYRLEGIDGSWIDAGSKRSVDFTGLRSGDYRFLVAASLSDGPWHPEGTSFRFSIAAPFTRSPYFLGAILTVLILGGLGLHRFRVARLKANAALLRQRARLARELHDTLAQSFSTTLIRLGVASRMVPEGADLLREQLHLAESVTRESLENVRLVVAELREESVKDLILGDLLAERVRLRLAGTGVKFVFTYHGAPVSFSPVATHHVCRIVDEAVSNALLHAQTPTIDLRVDAMKDVVVVSATNHGVNASSETAGGSGSVHGGLRGMYERAAEIGATLVIDGPEQGSWRVTLSVPIVPRPSH